MTKTMRPMALTRTIPTLLLSSLALPAVAVALATPVAAMPAHPGPSTKVRVASVRASPVALTADRWLRTMSRTAYAHHYRIDPVAGVFTTDCVGLVDHVLRRSAPVAWADLHERLSIRQGYVPRPGKWLSFLQGQRGSLPASWHRITRVNELRPGDVLLMGSQPKVRFVGHAVIIDSLPRAVQGGYAVDIIDSTGSPHGLSDTRRTDPRATHATGLGRGTMLLTVNARGELTAAAWSVDGHGPRMTGVQVAAGRALR